MTKIQATPSNGETEQAEGIRILIYGPPKMGKTRIVSTFPRPILFVGQDGSRSIATGKKVRSEANTPTLKAGVTESGNQLCGLWLHSKYTNMDLIRLTKTLHMDEALKIALELKYKTVCLDTGRDLLNLYTKEVLQLEQIPNTRTFGMGKQSDWGTINQQVIDVLFKFFQLNEEYGISTPLIAHEQESKMENVSPDIVKPSVGSDLTPQVNKFVQGACDYICRAYIARQEKEVDDGAGGKLKVATGKFEYRLHTSRHDIYQVGIRSVSDNVPEFIVDASYEKIMKASRGEEL